MKFKDHFAGAWSPAIAFLVLSAALIELVLQGADAGLWSTTRLRLLTYDYLAFRAGLVDDWIPNYKAQPYTMFLTYAFLHGGLLHLAFNLITLLSLGAAVVRDVGQLRFLLIYVGSTVTGAWMFAVVTTTHQYMVGASGALFGLAGALVFWNIRFALRQDISLALKIASIIWPLGFLFLLNVLMYYGFDKNVAWETHLGGFLGGVVIAAFMRTDDQHPPPG